MSTCQVYTVRQLGLASIQSFYFVYRNLTKIFACAQRFVVEFIQGSLNVKPITFSE